MRRWRVHSRHEAVPGVLCGVGLVLSGIGAAAGAVVAPDADLVGTGPVEAGIDECSTVSSWRVSRSSNTVLLLVAAERSCSWYRSALKHRSRPVRRPQGLSRCSGDNIGETVTCTFTVENIGFFPGQVTLLTETSPVPGGVPANITCLRGRNDRSSDRWHAACRLRRSTRTFQVPNPTIPRSVTRSSPTGRR